MTETRRLELAAAQEAIREFSQNTGLDRDPENAEDLGVTADVMGSVLGRRYGEAPDASGDEMVICLNRMEGAIMKDFAFVKVADLVQLALLARVGPSEGGFTPRVV